MSHSITHIVNLSSVPRAKHKQTLVISELPVGTIFGVNNRGIFMRVDTKGISGISSTVTCVPTMVLEYNGSIVANRDYPIGTLYTFSCYSKADKLYEQMEYTLE